MSRRYRVEVDPQTASRTRLVRVALACGAIIALIGLWWLSAPEEAARDEPTVAQPLPTPLPTPEDTTPETDQFAGREVARVDAAVQEGNEENAAAEADVEGAEDVGAQDGAAPPADEEPQAASPAASSADTAADEAAAPPVGAWPAASAEGRFRVESTEFAAHDTVREYANNIEEAGAPVVVLRRVAAGPFDNRAAADALRRQVREDHALDALVSGGADSGWRVQLGVFASEKNALALREQLVAAGTRVSVEARVQVGPYATRSDAETVRAALENMGLRAVQVVEQ